MTDLLEEAIRAARELSRDEQDEVALLVLALAEKAKGSYRFAPGEWESLQPSLEQARRGEFASQEDVEALWRKYGLDAP